MKLINEFVNFLKMNEGKSYTLKEAADCLSQNVKLFPQAITTNRDKLTPMGIVRRIRPKAVGASGRPAYEYYYDPEAVSMDLAPIVSSSLTLEPRTVKSNVKMIVEKNELFHFRTWDDVGKELVRLEQQKDKLLHYGLGLLKNQIQHRV